MTGPPLRIRLLGGLAVELDGRQRDLPSLTHARSLLGYLALNPGTHPRGTLAARFWPDVLDESARTSLRTALSAIRKSLGDDALVASRDSVALEDAWTDAAEFERLLAAGDAQGALALYRGPLLAGLDDDWIYEQRDAFRGRAGDALAGLAAAAESAGDADTAIAHTRAWAALDPLDETPVRELIRRLAAAGDRSAALTAYERLCDRLRTQLGVAPAAATRAVADAAKDATVTAPAPEAAPRTGGLVVLLFTDIVGSTEAIERLGEEAADHQRREHFRLLRDVISSHGGMDLKNLGDGLMVVFASAVDALRCAVAIQRAVARANARVPEEALEVRVGINAGEPFRDEDDWFGSPVVIAKRLCDRADGGQILASNLVRELAGARGPFSFRELGALALKGLSTPVAAVLVDWEAEPDAAPPLPAPLVDPNAARLVGREREATVLRERWASAANGEPVFALLSGDPGIGKTRLAYELCAEAHGAGATVLLGRCREELSTPYQPFAEALGRYVDAAPLDELRIGTTGDRRLLARLLPGLEQRLGGGDVPASDEAESDTLRLYEAVARLLGEAARVRPLMFVFDDAHWADGPSLQLLVHLSRELRDAPLMLVVTYRATEPGEQLIATLPVLRRTRPLTEIPLGGLDRLAVKDLVDAHDGDPAQVEGLLERTEGNPYFVQELLRESAGSAVPASIGDLIRRRLAELDEDTVRTLAAAAVAGPAFSLGLLATVTESSEDATLDQLERAIAAHTIREVPGSPDRFAFAHALVRETVYDAISAARRARMHARVGHALADSADAAVLAHHFSAAGDDDLAFTHTVAAARDARDVAAPDRAAELLDRAVELAKRSGRAPDTDAALCELLVERSELTLERSAMALARADAEAAVAGARALGDRTLMMRALNQLGYTERDRDQRRALPPHEEALAIARDLGDRAAEVRILNRLTLLHAVTLRFTQALDAGDRALAIARELGDPALLALGLDGCKLPAWLLGDLDGLEAITQELIELTPANRPWYLGYAVMESAYVPIGRRDWALAEERLAHAVELARRASSPGLERFVGDTRSWLRRGQGRLDEAIADAQAMTKAGERFDTQFLGWAEATLGAALIAAGDSAKAVPVLERGAAGAEANGATSDLVRCAGQLAQARCALGDDAGAMEAAALTERTLAAGSFPAGAVFVFGGHGIIGAAQALLACGESGRAVALAAPLAEAAAAGGWLEFAEGAAAVLAQADQPSGQKTS